MRQQKRKIRVSSAHWSIAPALKAELRPTIRRRLKALGLRGGGFTVWILLSAFDIIWRVFVAPLIRREERKVRAAKRAASIRKAASGIAKATTGSDLLAAYKDFYEKKD